MLKFTGERIVPQADNCEPNFASRMMHEHIARYLFAGQLVAGKSVLDVGCGVGYGAQKLGILGAKSVVAFDISADSVAHAKKYYAHPSVQFQVADAEDFDLNSKFDLVTCFEMIEHVPNPERVLECIKRHLKPDGFLVASTPRFLGQKRTHFHIREFSLDEYDALIKAYFPNTAMYVENNHFASFVTAEPPTHIDRVEYLKDQFSLAQADVFISVSSLSKARQPSLKSSLVFDDDRYVQMLERDVAVLHKAEDDIRASLEAERKMAEAASAFKDTEIARLIAEYNTLFSRAEADGISSSDARRAIEADCARLVAEGQAKSAEIARLNDEYNVLFQRSEAASISFAEDRRYWQIERERLCHLNSAELRLLTENHEREIANLTKAETDLNFALSEEKRQSLEFKEQKEKEIANYLEKISVLLSTADADAQAFAQTCEEHEKACDDYRVEIGRLTSESEALRALLAETVNQLKDAEMKVTELKLQQDALEETVASLEVRICDADARRLEAYEFARVASDETHALRREIEILTRDLIEALEFPEAIAEPQPADPRHRDIVESMERLFLGTNATHDVARHPLTLRVASLAIGSKRLTTDLEGVRAEAQEQKNRAERAESFAEDWHQQILNLRASFSWKVTKPLRALRRLFR